LVLKEKQKMTPVIAPREQTYGASVTDDLAALMPHGTPPFALAGRYVWVSMIANTAALPRESGVRPWAGSIK
jgi:hypothetical protein